MRGFGGVGGILRYKVDLQNLNVDDDAEEIDYSKCQLSPGERFSCLSRLICLGEYD